MIPKPHELELACLTFLGLLVATGNVSMLTLAYILLGALGALGLWVAWRVVK